MYGVLGYYFRNIQPKCGNAERTIVIVDNALLIYYVVDLENPELVFAKQNNKIIFKYSVYEILPTRQYAL